ncbi:hypothetical protein OU798_06960 [Prolixibacteraceae bacterium Z1-6]|uniref:Uncharacterized protein n=1 Tax=Draconibacterium aestuarii TaxID=2998507 RepID=A0A9X3J6W9_9BACT|nr:hypothetical protein [Prolixibacteraceae bacterium Z1-6]
MQNETGQEKEYIGVILEQISSKLQLKNPKHWQQRDFENLSNQIEEKSGISLSVSTLKRISKIQFQHIPQKNTLNALAQLIDYKDWYDFKLQNPLPEVKEVRTKRVKKELKLVKRFVYLPIFGTVALLIVILILNSETAQSYSEARFSSRKNVSEGVPNTVIFDYDISMYDVDSAFIQQSWDMRRRAEIEKGEKYSTSVYYFPGYHHAKLLINDQLVKEIPVYITTSGWLQLIQNPMNDLIPIYVQENENSEGRLYISPETVKNYNINLADNNHYTSFYYVNDDFNGDSDNFTFETRIKNSLKEGARTCQFCEISIFCEFGRHFLQFCDPGCIGSLYLKFGDEYTSGKNNDLSVFGTDLNEWNDVKMEFKNKMVSVFLNGKEIYKTSYGNSNGDIKGIFYRFAGSGSVDYIRLYDSEKELIFDEEFEKKSVS